uniref:Polynucleotide 5'-hydroxyl-kinase NOL9 n=1 Tax=Rhinolophus ferrumequinum TaxID=59479 RepID=A0A671ET36_RHIFE
MADSLLLLRKRGSMRSTWMRARKARPQLILSRRPRRRLRTLLRWCGRRRLRRRLLQAQAAGADWRESGCLVTSAAAAGRTKTAAPSAAPRYTPDEVSAPSCFTNLPVRLLRPVGPGRALLLLPLEQCFTFSGICRVTCLYGQVQVFGFTISQGQPSRDVFSTYTHSRLTIRAVPFSMPEKSKKEMKREARTLLRSHLNQDDRCWVMKNFSPLCSIVLLENLKTSTVNFIISHPGLSYIFVQESPTFQINSEYFALRSVGIKKEKKKNALHFTESVLSALEELVNDSCEEVDGCPVILICGAQDVGKSTFNRYLINQLLNSISCVDYLECDLGQTEFTPPGCISLLNITEPVLDKGLLLLIDLIRLLSPSHVVQFSSGRSKYMPNLTPDYVDDMDGLYTKSKSKIRHRGFHLPEFAEYFEFADEEKESPVLFTGHKLMCVKSDFAFRKTPRNRDSHNKILRDLAVLGYLGQLHPPVPKPLYPLQSLTPYQVPFNAVALRITHADVAPTHILCAVNASWVGLCRILDDVRGHAHGPILLAQTPICDCLGFGICRGIDVEKRLYHILTPVPPEELRNVNCLLVGAISVPHCVFKNQHGPEGMIPYITTDYNFKLPGASGKIGLRETEETCKEKLHPRPKFYRKTN